MSSQFYLPSSLLERGANNFGDRLAYMINENSIQFNIVSKNLGGERMAFFLNEAAGDIRDIMMPTLESKAKL